MLYYLRNKAGERDFVLRSLLVPSVGDRILNQSISASSWKHAPIPKLAFEILHTIEKKKKKNNNNLKKEIKKKCRAIDLPKFGY